ncbi:MAG: helix-turn-helix domain-containing protein [Egibacteraceae bacterium]
MLHTPDAPVGQRIAYWRHRRGLTQQVLAGLVGRSVPWLSLIERGDRTVEKIADLLALANVLKVEPGDLIGGVELPPNGGGPLDPPRGIPAIRRAVLVDRPPDHEPLDAAELRTHVEHARRLEARGSYEALVVVLPELIIAGRAAAAAEAPGAWWNLAAALQVASRVARKVGDPQLAWVAAERAGTAARRSGDGLMGALSERLRANALMRLGWLDEAGAVCSDGADAIAPTEATPIEGWAVWGTLQLTESVAAVRGGDDAAAWRLLRDARVAAERVGEGRNDYWQSFGPASTGLIEVTVALEAGNAVEALRIADGVEVDELTSAALRARFCVHVAQAHMLRRDDAAAVALLLEAERHSAETVRYSVKARELVRVCLGRERRSRTPGLRGLAERLGVTG